MKILLAIILIFPIFNIVAQNPVQPKDSTVGKDELIIISPEKKVHSDTSELMLLETVVKNTRKQIFPNYLS